MGNEQWSSESHAFIGPNITPWNVKYVEYLCLYNITLILLLTDLDLGVNGNVSRLSTGVQITKTKCKQGHEVIIHKTITGLSQSNKNLSLLGIWTYVTDAACSFILEDRLKFRVCINQTLQTLLLIKLVGVAGNTKHIAYMKQIVSDLWLLLYTMMVWRFYCERCLSCFSSFCICSTPGLVWICTV